MQIQNRTIGPGAAPFIIAEMSGNHNQSLDRALAIADAIAQAAPEDVVLIAGKGHEAWQEIAGQRLPFSDRSHQWIPAARLVGDPATVIARVHTDTRSLQPGDRLPPQRSLAARLQVDLTTITRAYDEAKRRHLVEGKGAAGTYASAPKVELAPMLDLDMNIPPPPAGVDFDDMLKQGLSQVLMRTDSDLLMSYQLGGASHIAPAAMFGKVDEDHVVACPGAQCALAALILALSEPGDVILAEPAIYPGLRTAAAQLGRRVAAVEVDEHGMRPDALEKACGKHGSQAQQHRCLVYLNPTLQNPNAHTMPEQRRRDILQAAARCGAAIIEDDPYWLLAEGEAHDAAYLDRRDIPNGGSLADVLANEYLETVDGNTLALPYLAVIRRKLPDIPINIAAGGSEADLCFGIIQERLSNPCLIELIWSYWLEEGMLVQTMNAITQRFQNLRPPSTIYVALLLIGS
eukprot:gene24392-27588_t